MQFIVCLWQIRDVFSHNSNINLVLDFMTTELEIIIKWQ